MLSRPKLSSCIYQNRKEKNCVDLVNILAMIDSDMSRKYKVVLMSYFMSNGWQFHG